MPSDSEWWDEYRRLLGAWLDAEAAYRRLIPPATLEVPFVHVVTDDWGVVERLWADLEAAQEAVGRHRLTRPQG